MKVISVFWENLMEVVDVWCYKLMEILYIVDDEEDFFEEDEYDEEDEAVYETYEIPDEDVIRSLEAIEDVKEDIKETWCSAKKFIRQIFFSESKI